MLGLPDFAAAAGAMQNIAAAFEKIVAALGRIEAAQLETNELLRHSLPPAEGKENERRAHRNGGD